VSEAWARKPFIDCLDKSPKTSKIPKKRFQDRGQYPIVSQEKDLINGYWDNPDDVVRVDHPVIVFGDHTQAVKLIDFDFVVGADGVKILKPKPFLDPRYFYYFLIGHPVKALGYARHFRLLKKLEVAIPSLAEQKRIVAILDEAFAGIETAITNTEKNIANAREVIDARLAVLFANRHQNWICGPLNDFVELVSTGPFGSLLHKSDYVSDGIPLINPVNIQGDSIVPDPNKRVDKEGFKKLRAYVLRAGDIVIARRGEIGRCAVISQEQDGWVCGTGCFFIRPSKKTDPCFLAHLLRSRPYREKLEQSATGATMLNLSNKVLAGLPVSMPAIDEQKKIADYISGFETDCLKISAVQKRKIYLLGELKQSLLQKAFSGELTTDRAERELAVVMP